MHRVEWLAEVLDYIWPVTQVPEIGLVVLLKLY